MNNLIPKSFLSSMGDPWGRDFSIIQRSIDRIFEDLASGMGRSGATAEFGVSPPCDLDESESHYVLSLDIPGLRKEDVRIVVSDNNRLTISGERKYEGAERKDSQKVRERYYGAFSRTFALPTAVDSEKVEATYDNGVLRVAMPKVASSKIKTVKISEGKTGFFSRFLDREEGDERPDHLRKLTA